VKLLIINAKHFAKGTVGVYNAGVYSVLADGITLFFDNTVIEGQFLTEFAVSLFKLGAVNPRTIQGGYFILLFFTQAVFRDH
jgi:hypothetical protein